MEKIKIESGIEIPPKRCGNNHHIYPFAEMKAGDSFFVPLENGDTITFLRNRIFSSGNSFKKKMKNKWAFSGRKVDGGIRFWRIK